MNIQDIFAEIDAEISKLQPGKGGVRARHRHQGAGSQVDQQRSVVPGKARTKRTLSDRGACEDRRSPKGSLGEIQEGREESERMSIAKVSKAQERPPRTGSRSKGSKKRTLSAGARAKIAAAQKTQVGQGSEGREESLTKTKIGSSKKSNG